MRTIATVRNETVRWTLGGVAIVLLSVAVVVLRPPLVQAGTGAPIARASASVVPTFADDSHNLLANGSFETESDVHGVAAKWVRTDQGGQYTLDDRAKYGMRSQRITKNATPDPVTAYSSVQQNVPVVGAHSYAISVDYQYMFESAADASRSVGIVIFSLDRSGKFIDDGTIVDWGWAPAAEWTRRTATFKTPSLATAVVVQLRLSVNGTVWFDGADLEDVSR